MAEKKSQIFHGCELLRRLRDSRVEHGCELMRRLPDARVENDGKNKIEKSLICKKIKTWLTKNLKFFMVVH